MSWRDYRDKKKNNILEDNDRAINQQKYVPKQTNETEEAKNRVKQVADRMLKNQSNVSTWDKVKNTASNMVNDIGNIGKNFGLGVSSASKNALYYIENMSENKMDSYRQYNQRMSKIKQQEEDIKKLKSNKINMNDITLPTEDYRQNIKKMTDEEKKQILLPKQPESLILKNIDESITKDEEQIQKNVESTSNKVLRKVAELTPSIAQSVTGMGASAINPAIRIRLLANICWRWIYKRSRKEWIYWKRCNAIWNYNG